MKARHITANICFFVGSPLLVLWSLYLLFMVFFWTGMGLRFGPPPPAGVYWTEFARTLGVFLLNGMLWAITCPLVVAVAFGWQERRKRKLRKV